MGDGEAATARVWSGLPVGAREQLERGLPRTDLQTLQLSVARARASRVSPAEVLRRWHDDRFVQPASVDPRRLSRVEADMWAHVPGLFEGVELSPVAPLGTCSAVAGVSQDRVVTTVRGTEVVSDSTNVLALEAATRRRSRAHPDAVHLASCSRQLRAQRFGEGMAAHFRLFTLVSSAQRQRSCQQESTLLLEHLRCWAAVLAAVAPRTPVRVEVTGWDPVLRERLHDTVLPSFAEDSSFTVVEDPDRVRAKGYYTAGALLVLAETPGGPVELGDGGFTDWTARLTQNDKELCLTSCIATERLAMVAHGDS